MINIPHFSSVPNLHRTLRGVGMTKSRAPLSTAFKDQTRLLPNRAIRVVPSSPPTFQKPKLLDQMREALRALYYISRTELTYPMIFYFVIASRPEGSEGIGVAILIAWTLRATLSEPRITIRFQCGASRSAIKRLQWAAVPASTLANTSAADPQRR